VIDSDTAGSFRPKTLANRIGNEYLLLIEVPAADTANGQARGGTSKHGGSTEIRISIPKSEVLIWGDLQTAPQAHKAPTLQDQARH
jgi:hypothetical protein